MAGLSPAMTREERVRLRAPYVCAYGVTPGHDDNDESDRLGRPAPRLAALWQAVAARMADLPVYNPKLTVQTTEFRRHGSWCVGVVVTPWFMNVVAVPDDPAVLPPPGTVVTVKLPVGEIEAIV